MANVIPSSLCERLLLHDNAQARQDSMFTPVLSIYLAPGGLAELHPIEAIGTTGEAIESCAG